MDTDTLPSGETIIIRTVEDLIQLNERQLNACLEDLKTWVRFRKELNVKIEAGKELLRKIGLTDEQIEASARVETQNYMGWIDDGIQGGELNVIIQTTMDGEEIAVGKFAVAPDGKITTK